METKKNIAIVLAGGQGRRMRTDVAKQYLLIAGKPVLYYSLHAFEKSKVDEIILVTKASDIQYCQDEIVNKYGFQKIKKIVPGGEERYHSVYAGLQNCFNCAYVLIHDGARPFLNQDMIERSIENAKKYDACVLGMPVKDTIKISDQEGYVAQTPPRDKVWLIQTPQSFRYELISQAYSLLMDKEIPVTDDAMVVETFLNRSVKLVEGSYENIKITTPEDLFLAEQIALKGY